LAEINAKSMRKLGAFEQDKGYDDLLLLAYLGI